MIAREKRSFLTILDEIDNDTSEFKSKRWEKSIGVKRTDNLEDSIHRSVERGASTRLAATVIV